MQAKRWQVMPRIPHSVQRRLGEFHPVMAQVLYNRGITEPSAAHAFLDGDMVDTDPFRMQDMSKAVARIRQAIKRQEQIVVYGDFDTDGVTSTALLIQTLRALGAKAEPYIPHRVDEGYGLNSPALQQLAKQGATLIITVDCGIRAVEEVREARPSGLDIIITDHHSIGPELPPAYAVLDPKREDCKYPEDMLAGVGVAFRLADALLRVASVSNGAAPEVTTQDLIDLVAIGTVADLAPLDRLENRAIVREGLKVLNAARRPGVYALLDISRQRPGNLKAMHIGFGLGPRLNAAGRLESAMTAYQLLITQDYGEAMSLARDLHELNARRQELTRETEEIARGLALDTVHNGDTPLIFAASDAFLPGIVGLVAGRLAEEFYRPAVVVEIGGEESRGSCRSIAEFNIIHALDQCADLLLRHGGHSQAAGFSIKNDNLPLLQERLLAIVQQALRGQDLRPTLDIDAEIVIEDLTMDLACELVRLEPTGHNNPQPMFLTRNLPVLDARPVGREGAHLKLVFGESGWYLDGIAFKLGDSISELPRRVDVVYHFEINEWNGRKRVQLNVQDMRPA